MLLLCLFCAHFVQPERERLPIAMVLEVKGKVEVQPTKGKPRFAAVYDQLYPGDRLAAEEKAQILVVFLHNGMREQLKEKTAAILRKAGCDPASAVVQIPAPKKYPNPKGPDFKPGARGAGVSFVLRELDRNVEDFVAECLALGAIQPSHDPEIGETFFRVTNAAKLRQSWPGFPPFPPELRDAVFQHALHSQEEGLALYLLQKQSIKETRAHSYAAFLSAKIAERKGDFVTAVSEYDRARPSWGFVLDSKKLTVTEILAGSPAERAGLKVGDIILQINGQKVNSLEACNQAIRQSDRALRIGIHLDDTIHEHLLKREGSADASWDAICLEAGKLAATAQAQKGKSRDELNVLHILIAADTVDADIGKGCRVDAQNIEKFLRGGIPEGRCKITVLVDGDCKRQKIVDYYSQLKAGPNDGVLFFYAGHGGMSDQVKREHFLTLNADPMSRAELKNMVRGTGAGLKVILTDCCSSIPNDRRQQPVKSPPVIAFGPNNTLHPGYAELFFRARGVVDFTAADDGLSAYGSDDGGYFAHAMMKALDAVKEKQSVTWAAFYSQVKKHTSDISNTKQTSRAFFLPGTSWGFVVDGNLTVVEVQPGSAAERAGLQPGDVLLRINGQNVQNKKELVQAMTQVGGNAVQLSIRNGANEQAERRLERSIE